MNKIQSMLCLSMAMAFMATNTFAQERGFNEEEQEQQEQMEQTDPTMEQDPNMDYEDPAVPQEEHAIPREEQESREYTDPQARETEDPEMMESDDPNAMETADPNAMETEDPDMMESDDPNAMDTEDPNAMENKDPEMKNQENTQMSDTDTPVTEDKSMDAAAENTAGTTSLTFKTSGEVNVASWPEASQKAVKEVTKKYGQPDGVTEQELIWNDAGVWKRIRISKEETEHKFPIAHTDMMEMTIMHDVPEDKMDELGEFDGSVSFDRTQGFLSARCDLEANNILALNLAHDIINDKKTVEEARTAYAEAIKEMMNGGKPEYQQKLMFETEANAADPDENTTGLTKKEVMKKMKKDKKGKKEAKDNN